MYAHSYRRRSATPRWMTVAASVFLPILLFVLSLPALADDRSAAMVYDVIGGQELYVEQPDEPRYPASLTKIMTIYITFEEVAAGRVSLDDDVTMSEWAASRPPSKIGIRPGGTIKVRDAIKALVTKSANDVATALGEHISGTETDFAVRMTKTAKRLGMTKTTFRNASGLPDFGQKTTARDLATLGVAIQRDFPQYYGVFQTRVFEFGKRRFGNHNRLVGSVEGVDGIKTGYINASGFNLVTSIRRDGRHLVAVVMGGATGGKRDARMRQLIAKYLPLAQSGDPMAYMAWSDEGPPPIPGRRPSLATRFASRLKAKDETPDPIAQTVMAFAAETRAAVGTDDLTMTPKVASDALQAVIAQADTNAGYAAAAEPLPSATSAFAALETHSRPVAGVATTEEVEVETSIGEAAIAVATRETKQRDPRVAVAFAAFDEGEDGAGDVLADAIRRTTVPTGGVTIIAMGSAPRTEGRRAPVASTKLPFRMPEGRTKPIRQNVDPDRRAEAPAAEPATRTAAATETATATVQRVATISTVEAIPDGWQIQVGAVPSQEAAAALLDNLAAEHPAMDKQARVTLPVAIGGGTLYRARFAGFASEGDAKEACKRFANHNRPCWAVSM